MTVNVSDPDAERWRRAQARRAIRFFESVLAGHEAAENFASILDQRGKIVPGPGDLAVDQGPASRPTKTRSDRLREHFQSPEVVRQYAERKHVLRPEFRQMIEKLQQNP